MLLIHIIYHPYIVKFLVHVSPQTDKHLGSYPQLVPLLNHNFQVHQCHEVLQPQVPLLCNAPREQVHCRHGPVLHEDLDAISWQTGQGKLISCESHGLRLVT